MKLKLNTEKRIKMVGLLRQYQGSIDGTADVVELIQSLRLSEEEKKEVEYQEDVNENTGEVFIRHNRLKDKEKEFEFTSPQIVAIKSIFTTKKNFSVDEFFIELAKQLGVLKKGE